MKARIILRSYPVQAFIAVALLIGFEWLFAIAPPSELFFQATVFVFLMAVGALMRRRLH
jgi:hypothetical protein